jgi:D-tyrosyl-tRNA(Tyr) deacylase
MKAIVQRVSDASVSVDGKVVGSCGKGLVVLVAVHRDDNEKEAYKMADKIWGLRIFCDEEDKMNLSLKDLQDVEPCGVLAVSNFTIYGETSKNRRPSFIESASYDAGRERFDQFVSKLRELGCIVETGVYGAHMDVGLHNDGPVSVIVEVVPKMG